MAQGSLVGAEDSLLLNKLLLLLLLLIILMMSKYFKDENNCKHLSDLTIQLILVCIINEQTRAVGHGGLSVIHFREHALFNNTPLLVN